MKNILCHPGQLGAAVQRGGGRIWQLMVNEILSPPAPAAAALTGAE